MTRLLYYKDNQWNICTEKIIYVQYGENVEQYVGAEGRGWWVDFAEKWEHTEIVEFVEVVVTEEQVQRLEDVNQRNVGDGYSETLGEYVINGIEPVQKDETVEPTEMELLGQQITDLEILILTGGMQK